MTNIIATIGPASSTAEQIQSLYDAGAKIFRLNFSHGDHSWHKKIIQTIKKVAPSSQIMLDTKGPEMRTGDLEKDLSLKKNELLTLVIQESDQDPTLNKIFVNHPGIINDVSPGDKLSLDSGLIELEVQEVFPTKVITKILHSGQIQSRRHLNLVEKDVSLPTLTNQDIADIEFGLQQNIDIIALSFTRKSDGILSTKELIKKNGKAEVKIFAKIESKAGIDNLEDIATHADGLMVARGDLGVETPLELVPHKQKHIINIAKEKNIPVIVATEMLDSMTQKPRPTRAEVSDTMLAVWQGADYVMLSAETAAGKYPLQTVLTMKKIIESA